MTIEERLTQLERKNRRLTFALVLTALAAILAVAVGMAAPEAVPDEVKARKFTLVDANGKVRASLDMLKGGPSGDWKGGPVFGLFDENGKSRAVLSVDKDGVPSLGLYDENGKSRVSLFLDKDGVPSLGLYDENGKTRVMLDVLKDRPGLILLDQNGRVLRELP